jgi:hypothetical protein
VDADGADGDYHPELFMNKIVVDPSSPQTLYAGTIQGIEKSTDGGVTWTASNTGITANDARALHP